MPDRGMTPGTEPMRQPMQPGDELSQLRQEVAELRRMVEALSVSVGQGRQGAQIGGGMPGGSFSPGIPPR